MKKINIFNRNTNSPSYRRMPVSGGFSRGGGLPFPWERGPAEQPGGMGITPSPFGATPSWKEGEHKVPSYRRMPVSRGFNRGVGIPLFSGMTVRICGMMIVIAALFATPSFAEPTELDKKTVASKAYVDTKQDKITTDLVEFNDNPEFMLPAITTYDSTSGLVANKIGILDQETILDDEGGLSNYDIYGAEMDNFVPTVRAVAEGLAAKQNLLPEAWTSTTSAYSMASTGGLTIELGAFNGSVDRRYITAGGSQPLTQKTGADNVMLYINGTKTLAQYQTSNFGGTGSNVNKAQNYIKGALVSLELLKDVYSELNSKITNNALPTGTTGTVVTYNGTNANTGVQQFTETAISGTATYDDNDQLTNGNNIANVSLVETEIATRQKKRTCAGYEPGHENEADYCWLWNFPDD